MVFNNLSHQPQRRFKSAQVRFPLKVIDQCSCVVGALECVDFFQLVVDVGYEIALGTIDFVGSESIELGTSCFGQDLLHDLCSHAFFSHGDKSQRGFVLCNEKCTIGARGRGVGTLGFAGLLKEPE